MSRSRGFTLIEVMVALALAAVAALAAHRLVTGVLDGVRRVDGARSSLDREANARRLLSAVVGSITVGDARRDAFHGGRSQLTFTTWHADVRGRAVRRRVSVAVEDGALTARGVGAEPVRLRDGVSDLALDYLLELGEAERFVREWYSDASPPLAVRFRVSGAGGRDTLLVLVGERG